MTSTVTVIESGIYTTLQDLGRTLGKPFGVPPGGALDRYAHLTANQLVGNMPEAATLEITLIGPVLRFEEAALISLTGADLQPSLNGIAVPNWCSLFVRAGQVLQFGRKNQSSGKLTYLAIHGGWEAPLLLGSRATNTRAKMGGYNGEGRQLKAGDILSVGNSVVAPLRWFPEAAGKFAPPESRPPYGLNPTIHLIPGPYQENFSPEAFETLYSNTYTISPQSDRMGYRLDGKPLSYSHPDFAEIAACGTVFGTIQVPPDGQPIILMADHQVTGGYPIIGVVATDDLPLVAQLLPGQSLHFSPSTN